MSNLWGAFQEANNLAFFILPIVQCEPSPTFKSGLVVQRMPRVSEGFGTLVT